MKSLIVTSILRTCHQVYVVDFIELMDMHRNRHWTSWIGAIGLQVLNECIEHHDEAWMRLKKRYQDALPKYTTKLFFSVDVKTNMSS
ncbi:hypothetical protein QQ045_012144 [Rhodiola kirilowii]